jgi:hypothetical protein
LQHQLPCSLPNAQGIITIDQSSCTLLTFNLNIGTQINTASPNPLDVSGQSENSVTISANEV